MNNVFAIGDQCIQLADENYPNGHPQLAFSIRNSEGVCKADKKFFIVICFLKNDL